MNKPQRTTFLILGILGGVISYVFFIKWVG